MTCFLQIWKHKTNEKKPWIEFTLNHIFHTLRRLINKCLFFKFVYLIIFSKYGKAFWNKVPFKLFKIKIAHLYIIILRNSRIKVLFKDFFRYFHINPCTDSFKKSFDVLFRTLLHRFKHLKIPPVILPADSQYFLKKKICMILNPRKTN